MLITLCASGAVLGGVFLVFVILNTKGTGFDVSELWPVRLAPVLVGGGAAFIKRRITAGPFAVMCAFVGLVLIVAAMMGSFGVVAPPLVFGLLCFLPVMFVIRAWDKLG
ncbi:hypothetical protein [Cyanobium sp. CH-040]|uniref:hypothetical protein n=1 Tax=Cyanobium sp. CH-040 TaxID=2823708 RepID=UPI0020CC7CF3|nr:hypothetical protein [Cyanobium sp. CH-040]